MNASEATAILRNLEPAERARVVADLVQPFIQDDSYLDYFADWERQGFHIVPNGFYQPIPEEYQLKDELWRREIPMPGIDMNDQSHLHLLRDVFPQYAHESAVFPEQPGKESHTYFHRNRFFPWTDSSIAWGMLRHLKPRRLVELGSGFSTLLMAEACAANGGETEYVVVDPYPRDFVRSGVPGVTKLIASGAENIEDSLFAALDDGDVLFVDTSHVVKTGGEVNHLYLNIIPKLRPGVYVHVHDIFFPREYPKIWLKERRYFWTEQYLLHAFLSFNSAFEVIYGTIYATQRFLSDYDRAFPYLSGLSGGGSLWMRRRPEVQP